MMDNELRLEVLKLALNSPVRKDEKTPINLNEVLDLADIFFKYVKNGKYD